MAQVQFASQAYQARSPQLIKQQCINAFVETSPKEAKTPVPVYGAPGTSLFSGMGTSTGPILGMHVMGDSLYAVSGDQLFQVTKQDTLNAINASVPAASKLLGTTNFGGSLLSMADNTRQLVMVDGSVGWVYQPGGLNQVTTATANAGDTTIPANITGTITAGDALQVALDSGATFNTTAASTVTGASSAIELSAGLPSTVTSGAIIVDPVNALGRISAAAFQPAATVAFMDGYFCFDAAGTRQWFISGLNDGTQYSGLDFAEASASSSNVQRVMVYHEQVLIFTETTIEVWWDTGNVSFPFQRYDAALIARGIAAPLAACAEDNSVFWLGEDGVFYRLVGFAGQRVSTFAMEHAWAQYPLRYLDASCFVLDQEGHKFIVLNFPSGDATWVYDIAVGLWHQRESRGARSISFPAPVPPPAQYCAVPITITSPTLLKTAAAPTGLPASFAAALFFLSLDLPRDGGVHGVIFSNQTDDTNVSPNAGLFIEIANDQTETPQITIMAWDASNAVIVSATYDFAGWSTWIDALISIDTATQQIAVYATDAALTPVALTWSSTNPIGNPSAQPWHVVNTPTPFVAGAYIAELVVPNDAYGTLPSGSIVDWVNGKVYLIRGFNDQGYPNPGSIRSYLAELVTQNPIASAFLYSGSGGTWYCGDADPVTGAVLIQGSNDTTKGGSNAFPIGRYDPVSLALTASFGSGGIFPSYPTSIWAGEALVCVGCGTLASGGSVQVGYALLKESAFSGYVAVIRTDTMKQAGAYPSVVSGDVNGHGRMCRGASGAAGASVFLVPSNYSSAVASFPLYTVQIAPGAETYDPSTWPATNSYITNSTIGSVAASAVDATWTSMWAPTQIGYDATDGNVLLDVFTSNAVTNKRYIVKVSASDASVIWATPVANVTDTLNLARVAATVTALKTGSADVITVSSGALASSTLNGLVTSVAASDDTSGLILVRGNYTEEAGSPIPIAGTPSSFTNSWAIAQLSRTAPTNTANLANLWFSDTPGFVDPSMPGVRGLFFDGAGCPVFLGTDGSLPFGTQPPVFLTRVAGTLPDTWAVNAGAGGPFAITGGDLTDAPSAPCCSTQA